MSTRQNRKAMNVVNDTLRADNATLRNRQGEMLSHIQTLIRRQKQLVKLKEQLLQESQKAKDMMMRQRISKQQKCMRLQIQLDQMTNEVSRIDITLANLEEEYQICLKDYDKVLGQIANVIETNKVIESQLSQEIQKKSTIQAMIFDYERLERVLEQERKYFRQLASTEEKSHAQRMKEFQSIRQKLIKQEKQCFKKKFMDRFRMGYLQLSKVVSLNFKHNASTFIRGFMKFEKHTQLGISKFKNCLQIATTRYKKQLKRTLTSWHHNVFPKSTLNNIVENSLRLNFQSRTKIKVLNKIVQKLNSDNLSLLHLYERTKIVCLTANAIKRKQVHIAFCRWRDQSVYLTRVKFRLENMQEIISTLLKRNSFNVIKDNVHLNKRFQVASHLLTQYENTKGMAWAMRKWRLQLTNREINVMERYVQNIKKHNLIQQRVKYQKRKVKALTNLQLFMTKIQLRNYFSRYYQNVKTGKIIEVQHKIQALRQQCSEARKQNRSVIQFYTKKNTQMSLNILFNWMRKYIVNDAYQAIKRLYELENAKRQALMLVMLKKQGKNKYYVMNQFRKNAQYYQKKQMHQVLTDLNNKMEQINQKSTKFRQELKETIEELGAQSSKKINQVFQYTLNCQQKVFFNWYSRKNIQKNYKSSLIQSAFDIFTKYAQNNVFKTIQDYCKDDKKQKLLLEKQKKYLKQQEVKTLKKVFNAILCKLKIHKKAFAKLIHVENVMFFYRLQYAMIAIMKKSHQEALKSEQKVAQQLNKQFLGRQQNLNQLKGTKNNLQNKLKNIFSNFINFQQISQKNKEKNFVQNQKKKYFQLYRENVQKKKQANETLSNFVKLLQYKNYFIFWKSVLIINYQSQQVGLKDELGKINKKRKGFDEKIFKTKTDVERRLVEAENQHETKQTEANYYLQKYSNILSYYDVKHRKFEDHRYMRDIFRVWKRQYLGAKKVCTSLTKVLHRAHLIEPYHILYKEFKNYDNQYKSQLMSVSLLQRKHKKQLYDGFTLWRYNMRHGYSASLKYKVDHIDDHRQEVRTGVFSKGEFYADEVIRNKRYNLKATIFMAFKNEWIRVKQVANKINPLLDKIQHQRMLDAVRNWKWLIYYKKTKRAYLEHKKLASQKNLKRDVFLTLKMHRQQIYNLAYLGQNFIINRRHQLKRFAMSKIMNVASYQKNQLNYKRHRAIHTLLLKKLTQEKLIKRTVMWKWQSELIPRQHYLCNVLKSIQLRILKSAFANINQKKYWNQHYIKDIAEKVTTEGYSDVNSITNILVREGFDPDQLKDYLQKKNQKDTNIIKQVMGHIQTWPKKPHMVQAFHSWKQYVSVRKNIKKALSKVFNFSSGLGRYFDRWRKKDPAFNQILQRESRESMLQRYYDLQRLMKEYRRDIKNSDQNCQQLRLINDEYAKSTKITIESAFSNIANSVHKGMKQGFQLWRVKAKQYRVVQTNKRYDEIVDGIEMLDQHKRKVRQKIKMLENQNIQLKQKCKWGQQCGYLLNNLMQEKDGLTIDLAEKQHNLKILLEDNLRLKQKIKIAQTSALRLINKIRVDENIQE